jgi:delta 1-pyrroline-5-carboxylate dehydrogenase
MRCYNVSDIAAYIGLNPYESPCDKIEKQWKRESKVSYYRAINRNKPTESYQQQQADLNNALRSQEAQTMRDISFDETKNTSEKVNATLDVRNTSGLTHGELTQLQKHMKSKVSTQHGIKHEATALDMYTEQTRASVQKHTKVLEHTHNNQYKIRGKVDGIADEKVVEIKNRARRLFGKVVPYEYCQVQLYMHMLEKSEADLVESYNGVINIFPIEYDPEYVQLLLDKLERVDTLIHKLHESKDVQNSYFADREQFITTLLSSS